MRCLICIGNGQLSELSVSGWKHQALARVCLQAIQQLKEYFEGERKEFSLPLLMVGTEFQQSVWNELIKVSYGETETYLSLTNKVGNMNTIRAVAAANGANAISIIVPCHRIIGSDGNLVGYAGGLDAKKKLLQLENKDKFPEQLELFG